MGCSSCGGSRRTNTQAHRRTSTGTAPAAPGDKWTVTLGDGTVHTDLSEHDALMLTLRSGGAMEKQDATPN